MIYLVILAIYLIIAILGKNEVTQEWRLESQKKLPAIPIQVQMHCSSKWGCFDNWGLPSQTKFVQVLHRYSNDEDAERKCGVYNSNFTVESAWSITEFETSLCYSDSYINDGLDIQIPFDAKSRYGDDTSLSVTIISPSSSMLISVDIEPYQRKTIFINQQAKERLRHTIYYYFRAAIGFDTPGYQIDKDSAEPFQSDLFYDGKNTNTTALLRIRANQLASVATIVRIGGNTADKFAQIGGMHSIIWLLVTSLRRFILRSKDSSVLDVLISAIKDRHIHASRRRQY